MNKRKGSDAAKTASAETNGGRGSATRGRGSGGGGKAGWNDEWRCSFELNGLELKTLRSVFFRYHNFTLWEAIEAHLTRWSLVGSNDDTTHVSHVKR